MANVWFSVIVLIFVQNVFANVCMDASQISNCDQCIRCGGSWCSQKTDEHCTFTPTDVWCEGEPEVLARIDQVETNGKDLQPIYAERTIFIENPDSFPFVYFSPVERKVVTEIYNTTQNFVFSLVAEKAVCVSNKCSLTIEAKVTPDFCTSIGTDMEFIYVKIKVENMTEESVVKYHVPCACECSKKVEKKSAWCNGKGDYACGVCKCYEGWSGEDCQTAECGKKRGDVQCNNPLKNDVECSGNGYCGPCETCICFTDREGSQYFDPENYCSDICMDTSGCGQCLTNGTLGMCDNSPATDPECIHPMSVQAYNETIAAERELDEKVWVSCNDTFVAGQNPKCYVEYVAMKDENGIINVMVVKSCNNYQAERTVGVVGTNVPIIVGVLGLIAAVAAVGGVMLWKHLNATPPMPFSSPDYQNIDAEDCVGENPLYKSPTTTFTNPQFGKC